MEPELDGPIRNFIGVQEQTRGLPEQAVVLFTEAPVRGGQAVEQWQDRRFRVLGSCQVLGEPLAATGSEGADRRCETQG